MSIEIKKEDFVGAVAKATSLKTSSETELDKINTTMDKFDHLLRNPTVSKMLDRIGNRITGKVTPPESKQPISENTTVKQPEPAPPIPEQPPVQEVTSERIYQWLLEVFSVILKDKPEKTVKELYDEMINDKEAVIKLIDNANRHQ